MCVQSQSQPGRENQLKLLYPFHRFLSRPVLGPGITSEETSLRYTAFVCFFFSLLFKQVVSLYFQSPTHTKKYLTEKSFRLRRDSAITLDAASVCQASLASPRSA